jgi:hypothetical protein
VRLSVRLTGTTLRLTGSRAAWTRPGQPPPDGLLVTELGEPLATEQGEQFLAGALHGQ